MPLEYITNREISNNEGEVKGKIKIMKMREDDSAQIEFACPGCGFLEKRKEKWGEPFTTGTGSKQFFSIKCGKCNLVTKLLKLKKEAAKKKK